MLNHYYIAGAIVGAAVVVAATCIVARKFYKKEDEEKAPSQAPAEPMPESPEERFVTEWTQAFRESAKTFNGLYQGLQRVVEGKAKKPEKVLREWCARTRYRWEEQPPSTLCEELIVPLLEGGEQTGLDKWAKLLLQAAESAGITRGQAGELTLDEQNVNDFTEWEGGPLYVEDEVEVMQPAWYQDGALVEQGRCRKKEGE